SVYPWVAARGDKVSVTVYHTDASGTPDTVAAKSQWFEAYLESTDGGGSFTALAVIDPLPVKSGPICTQGTGCSANRELLDFQSVALDGAGRAHATWTRSIDGVSNTEIRVAPRCGGRSARTTGRRAKTPAPTGGSAAGATPASRSCRRACSVACTAGSWRPSVG